MFCPTTDNTSENTQLPTMCKQPYANDSSYWCQQTVVSSSGKLCPTMQLIQKDGTNIYLCAQKKVENNTDEIKIVEEKVPKHNRSEGN